MNVSPHDVERVLQRSEEFRCGRDMGRVTSARDKHSHYRSLRSDTFFGLRNMLDLLSKISLPGRAWAILVDTLQP